MRLWERLFVRADVVGVQDVGRFRRVLVRAAALRDAEWRPGQQVRVHVGRPGALGPLLRTYSVWERDGDVIELWVLMHGDGPGARFMGRSPPAIRWCSARPRGTLSAGTGNITFLWVRRRPPSRSGR